MGLFSGGNSKSSSSTTTTNVDKRVVADAGSVAVSGDRVELEILDAGAIASAFAFAGQALAAQQQTAVGTLELARSQVGSSIDAVGKAYADGKGSGLERYALVAGLVALVAIVMLRRGLPS